MEYTLFGFPLVVRDDVPKGMFIVSSHEMLLKIVEAASRVDSIVELSTEAIDSQWRS